MKAKKKKRSEIKDSGVISGRMKPFLESDWGTEKWVFRLEVQRSIHFHGLVSTDFSVTGPEF